MPCIYFTIEKAYFVEWSRGKKWIILCSYFYCFFFSNTTKKSLKKRVDFVSKKLDYSLFFDDFCFLFFVTAKTKNHPFIG